MIGAALVVSVAVALQVGMLKHWWNSLLESVPL
jgi:hypothetical protein